MGNPDERKFRQDGREDLRERAGKLAQAVEDATEHARITRQQEADENERRERAERRRY